MTGIDVLALVRKVFPDVSEDGARDLLWCCTAFPFVGDPQRLEDALIKARDGGDGTVDGAIAWSHDQLDHEYEHYMSRKNAENSHD